MICSQTMDQSQRPRKTPNQLIDKNFIYMKNSSMTMYSVSPRANPQKDIKNMCTLDPMTQRSSPVSDRNTQKDGLYVGTTQVMSKTLNFDDYQGKMFKIRTPTQSVKSARGPKYLPFQRIRKVNNLIEQEKQRSRDPQIHELYQKQQQQDRSKIKQRLEMMRMLSDSKEKHLSFKQSPTQTPKVKNFKQPIFASPKATKAHRQKEIEELIKNTMENRHKINYTKLDSFERNPELVSISPSKSSKQRYPQGVSKPSNRSPTYSQMVRNRQKLKEKQSNKKKSIDHSLLDRINNINSVNSDGASFILRNSFQKNWAKK